MRHASKGSARNWHLTGRMRDDCVFHAHTSQAPAEEQAPDDDLVFGDDTQPVRVNLPCVMVCV